MNLTTKQREILSHIIEANADGSALDVDQLLVRLSYAPSKQAVHFSLRFIIAKGLIMKAGREQRRKRSRMILVPTPAGMHLAKGVVPLSSSAFVLSEDEAEMLHDLESV